MAREIIRCVCPATSIGIPAIPLNFLNVVLVARTYFFFKNSMVL